MLFRLARRSASKSLLPLILAVPLLTACSTNNSAPQPGFWDPGDSRVYSKLSTNQESDSVNAAQYLSQLISKTQTGSEDAMDFAGLTTSSLEIQSAAYDQVLEDELTKCVFRHSTVSSGGTTTVKTWYDNAEGHICPIILTATESVTSGSPDNRSTAGTHSVTISFAAKEFTRQYDEGKIRRMSLTHSENSYTLALGRHPDAAGLDKLMKSVTGSMDLGATTVTFAINHSRDVSSSAIDDSTSARSGRELKTVTIGMPFGLHAVTSDQVYTPNSQTPLIRKVVNGVEVSNNKTKTN